MHPRPPTRSSLPGHLRHLTTRVSHVLPVSDDGGSTAEIVRVLGGPAVGDIRSRCLRLADESDEEVGPSSGLVSFETVSSPHCACPWTRVTVSALASGSWPKVIQAPWPIHPAMPVQNPVATAPSTLVPSAVASLCPGPGGEAAVGAPSASVRRGGSQTGAGVYTAVKTIAARLACVARNGADRHREREPLLQAALLSIPCQVVPFPLP